VGLLVATAGEAAASELEFRGFDRESREVRGGMAGGANREMKKVIARRPGLSRCEIKLS
jgi:hypothetical protein